MNQTRTFDVRAGEETQHAGKLDWWLATRLQSAIASARVRLEMWNGSSPYAGSDSIGSVVVRDRRTLFGLVIDPDLSFGEAYMARRLEIRGDLEAVLEALSRAATQPTWLERLRRILARSNSLRAARDNAHHHYDLGNEFYARWLDRDLVYTCAYFTRPDISLEAAQHAKFDLVCRKLRLQPGETVVEAGCGWGTFALYMARHFGVRVRAFNVSREQLAYARARAAREGLADRVEFVDDDYRNITGEYDAFVSVGMLEHIGARQYAAFSRVLRRVVRPGGRGLLHFIGRDTPRPLNAWIRRRIFPGAYPPTLAEVGSRILGPATMSIVDVENLRLHYARTIEHWRRRFDVIEEDVRAQYGDAFERAWRLYLAGSQAAFAAGSLQLFQVVFATSDTPPPYWARGEMYRSAEPEGACGKGQGA
jgi:cyclopropane-fatty-acyl-phospholipid synthase